VSRASKPQKKNLADWVLTTPVLGIWKEKALFRESLRKKDKVMPKIFIFSHLLLAWSRELYTVPIIKVQQVACQQTATNKN